MFQWDPSISTKLGAMIEHGTGWSRGIHFEATTQRFMMQCLQVGSYPELELITVPMAIRTLRPCLLLLSLWFVLHGRLLLLY